MKLYTVTVAYDVPCYAHIKVTAASPEIAQEIALEQAKRHDFEGTFEPDWSAWDMLRVADVTWTE